MKEPDVDNVLAVVDKIDESLINLSIEYDIHPSDMCAIVLARLVAIAKETNGKDSLLVLLDAAKYSIINLPEIDNDKVLH